MKKSIICNDEMVRAILEGRKSVIRRAIKPHNPVRAKPENYRQRYGLWIDRSTDNPDKAGHIKDYSVSPLWMTFPYYIDRYAPYKKGQTIYIRETWNGFRTGNEKVGHQVTYWYRADDTCDNPDDKWRPSAQMPKDAARIFLRVAGVGIERLQDITVHDLQDEGILPQEYLSQFSVATAADDAFAKAKELWDSAVPKKELAWYGWDANPYVWVIEFERCEKSELDI